MRSPCPACGRCPFAGGVCEDRVNRGRRFFLLGALALPVARKVEVVAGVVAPAVRVIDAGFISWSRFDPRVVAAIQERTLRHVFRDSLFPRLVTHAELDAKFGPWPALVSG